jgi:hypothetical protein
MVAVLLMACTSSGLGQYERGSQGQAQQQVPGTANYRFAELGELTITVSIIGAVRNPGRYEISRSINLLDLVALAGGYQDYGDESDISVTRYDIPGASGPRKNYRVDLSDLTRLADSDVRLQQGDIINVPGSPNDTFDDVLRYLTSLAVLVTAGIAVSAGF